MSLLPATNSSVLGCEAIRGGLNITRMLEVLRYSTLPVYFYVMARALSCILFLHPFSQSLATLLKTEFARAGCTILVGWTLRLREVYRARYPSIFVLT